MTRQHHQVSGHESGQTPGDGEGREMVKEGCSTGVLQSMGMQKVGHDLASEQQ